MAQGLDQRRYEFRRWPAEPRREKGNAMRRKSGPQSNDLRPEYAFDYSKAVRGKYYRRLVREGTAQPRT